jgi:outer membrane protein insertion porin family
VDLNYDVTEKSTGSVMFGAGLSSSEGVVLGVTVNQANFLGTGNRVSAQVNTGKVNKTYSLSYTDPYFTADGISRGFDVYRKDVNSSSLNIGNYNTSSYGAGVRFGVPLNERDTIGFGLTADYTSIELNTTSPSRYQKFCGGNPPTTYSSGCDNAMLRTDLSWTHDTRDNILFPNRGVLQRLSGEIGLPGLDLQYYKVNYQHVWYKDFSKTITLMLNGELGFAGNYGGGTFPFYKNFYVGGVNSVRGFDTSSMGPTAFESTTNASYGLGGTRRIVGNAELFFPVPMMKDNKQLRLSAFLDAGTVWGGTSAGDLLQPGQLGAGSPGSCSGASDCMRYSTGLGISWYSPFGPIKLVLAKPLNEKTNDKTQMLQFQMGSQF